MPADEELAGRLRTLLTMEADLVERRMFGGIAFSLGGHLAVAASGQGGLMVRVDPLDEDTLLAEPGAGPMVMRGRPVAGWLRVGPDAVAEDEDLRRWVARGVARARALPPQRG